MAADAKAREAERCAKYRVFKAIDDAYRKGDIDALLVALGTPPTSRIACIPGIWGSAIFRSSTRFIGVRLRSLKRFSTMGQIPTTRIGVDSPH